MRSPPRLGSRASSQAAMPVVLSGSDRDNPRPTTSSGTRGHGQHLQSRSVVSDPDNRHVDHLGPDATLRAVEPSGDYRPRQRLMIFKSVGVLRPDGTVTCVVGTRGCLLSKIHPAYISRILRLVRAPADDSVAPWSSSPSPGLFPATRPRPVLSQAPPPEPIAAEPDGRRVLSRGGAADHE